MLGNIAIVDLVVGQENATEAQVKCCIVLGVNGAALLQVLR